MVAIKRVHTKGVFQQDYAVDVLHSTSVGLTFGVVGIENVHPQKAAGIVVIIVAIRLHRCAVLRFSSVMQTVIQIHDFIQTRLDLLVQIMISVQRANLNGLCNVIRQTEMDYREFLR